MLTSKFAKLSKRKGAKNAFLVGLYNDLTGGRGGGLRTCQRPIGLIYGREGVNKGPKKTITMENFKIGLLEVCAHIYMMLK